ncbi:MAG: tRNA pseudouridine(55) synthase TruB [Halanaerobiaceae bacterium]|jgi:tRNA pseudouridine55 synthase|nr:tRNA pseudouridine(55) synthase TruB [Halanaerobiaceae bacterium]
MCKINGIINIMKPSGMTSYQVVSRVKKLLSAKKAGHTGTLDPAARGVLPVCLGKATRVIPFIPEGEKEYIAEIFLGVTTDTLDGDGRITSRNNNWHVIDINKVNETLQSFVGEIDQLPPMYSAVHYQGRRLYQLAREGKSVEREKRKIKIHELELLDFKLPVLKIRILCSKGTYVRTLADDIGKSLSVGAHLKNLIRTKSGPFSIEDAVELEDLKVQGEQKLLPLDYPLSFPVLKLNKESLSFAENGVVLYRHNFAELPYKLDEYLKKDKRVSIYYNDYLVSINELDIKDNNFECKPIRVFNMHLS